MDDVSTATGCGRCGQDFARHTKVDTGAMWVLVCPSLADLIAAKRKEIDMVPLPGPSLEAKIRARLDELWRPMVCEGQDHGLCVDSCICSRYEHKPSPENAALRAVLDLGLESDMSDKVRMSTVRRVIAEYLGVSDE